MPLADPKTHTFAGKTAGTQVAAGEFTGMVGTAPTYLDKSGDIVASVSTVPTGTQAIVYDDVAGDSKFGQATFDFGFDAAPSVAQEAAQIRNATGKVTNLLTNVSSGAPTARVRGGADAALTGWTTDTVLATGVRYRVRIAVEVGTTTSNGRTKAELIRVSDSVVLASGESLTLNNGTANVTRHQLAKLAATGTTGLWIDNVATSDQAYAYLASPAPAAGVPTANAGQDQTVEPWAAFTLDFSGSTASSGSITSYAVTQIAGPTTALTGTGSTRSGTAPATLAGTVLTYRLTVTQTGGATATDDVSITVPYATETAIVGGVEVPYRFTFV